MPGFLSKLRAWFRKLFPPPGPGFARLYCSASKHTLAGRHQEARDLLLECNQHYPGDLDVLRALASAYSQLDDWDHVESIATEMAAHGFEEWSLRFRILTAGCTGRAQDELALASELTSIAPEEPWTWIILGDCYLGTDLDRAIEYYSHSLAIDPTHEFGWERFIRHSIRRDATQGARVLVRARSSLTHSQFDSVIRRCSNVMSEAELDRLKSMIPPESDDSASPEM